MAAQSVAIGGLVFFQHHVEDVLAELEGWVVPEMRLTLAVRHPTNPECNVIFTRDDLEAVAALLLKKAAQQPRKETDRGQDQ